MPNFLKTILATLLGLFIFFGLSIGGLLLLVVALGSRDTTPKIRDKSVLVFDLSLSIRDMEPVIAPEDVLRQSLVGGSRVNPNVISLRRAVESIDQASKDSRIVALYLRGSTTSTPTGLANLREVRQALERFRASGKQIIAYDIDWTEREYYLGSVANTVVLNPLGTFEMNGLSSETMFLTGALKKYGVDVQVSRVGKYKSAVEPFLLTKNSPEHRQQEQKLLWDLWNDWLATVSKNRKLTAKQLQAIASDQAILIAQEALDKKLIDKLAQPSDIKEQLKQLTGSKADSDSFRQVSLKNYSRAVSDKKRGGKSLFSSNYIAILYASGDIQNGNGDTDSIGAESYARQLRQLREDDSIKAIVLRINSPGGSVTASEIIQQEVILARKKKPVVVSMGNVAASGGYWIATYADRIFAEPSTITGSIGVFGLLPNVQKLGNNQGLTWDTVKTAQYADIDTISRPRTPAELAINQKLVDWFYDEFLKRVAESRKLSKAKVAEIAQGRVWSGVEAKKLGLVDELGGLESAVREAAKRAKLGDDWQLEEYPNTRGFQGQLLEQLSGEVEVKSVAVDPITNQFQQLQREMLLLRSLNDPRNVYMRLPFTLNID